MARWRRAEGVDLGVRMGFNGRGGEEGWRGGGDVGEVGPRGGRPTSPGDQSAKAS